MVHREVHAVSVSTLTEWIKDRLESDGRLTNCCVVGEISNFKHHTSGHMYFTLKDDKSRLRSIMFSSRNRALPFMPEDGMRVICVGSISVFDRDGQYQLYVDDMQPDGLGALYAAFEQLRNRLASEGLFDEARKRPLPLFPRRIGVVTSPTGAVIRDICTTLERRYPLATVVLAPALVQGPGAASSLVSAIRRLCGQEGDQDGPMVDVLIVGRGGGSLEELWPFNEESVARAVAAATVPVVSAVGHETDVTICDYVADVRAATPTAAAELVAPNVSDLRIALCNLMERGQGAIRWQLRGYVQRLGTLETAPVLKYPVRVVDARRQRLDSAEADLRRLVARPVYTAARRLQIWEERLRRTSPEQRLIRTKSTVDRLAQSVQDLISRRLLSDNNGLERLITGLEALNPLNVLKRGYSVVYRQDGESVVTSIKDVHSCEEIRIRMVDGTFSAVVGSGGTRPADKLTRFSRLREKGDPDDRGSQSRLDV